MSYPWNLILSLVILFIIIFICFKIIINHNKKIIKSITNDYDKYKNELKKQNEQLAKQLLEQSEMIKNIDAKNTEKGLFKTFIKLRNSIKENCIVTMNKVDSARLAIYLLHNGTHSTHGINFFKMSCICEKVAIGSGVRERMMEHTNIPINLFDDMIDKLIVHDRYIIMNNDVISDNNHKIFVSSDKIKYTQLVAIYDINNNMLGFIAAEMNHPYEKNLADKEKEYLDELSKQLVPVLSYSDYVSLNTLD